MPTCLFVDINMPILLLVSTWYALRVIYLFFRFFFCYFFSIGKLNLMLTTLSRIVIVTQLAKMSFDETFGSHSWWVCIFMFLRMGLVGLGCWQMKNIQSSFLARDTACSIVVVYREILYIPV